MWHVLPLRAWTEAWLVTSSRQIVTVIRPREPMIVAGGCDWCTWWRVWPTRTAVAGQPRPHGRSAGARAGAPGPADCLDTPDAEGLFPNREAWLSPRPSLWLGCALRLPTRPFLSGLREGGALSQKGGLPEVSGRSRSASLEVTRKLKLLSLWAAARGCPRFFATWACPSWPCPAWPCSTWPLASSESASPEGRRVSSQDGTRELL